jgi:c-di-GMP-binding flagellar brake protein YcgR
MIELRKAQRINIIWRAALKMADGRLVMCKVVNISTSGLLIQSPISLTANREYQMMVEIPGIDEFCNTFKVSCTIRVMHAILSGEIYRVGVQFTSISSMHQELVNAWISKTVAVQELT